LRTGRDLVEIGEDEVGELQAEIGQDEGGVDVRMIGRSQYSDESHVYVASATQVLDESSAKGGTRGDVDGGDEDYVRD